MLPTQLPRDLSYSNKDRIAKLLRFITIQSDEATVSLADYIGRMKEGQDKIYYVTAETFAAAKNSPHLEIFRKKGIEVLLLAERGTNVPIEKNGDYHTWRDTIATCNRSASMRHASVLRSSSRRAGTCSGSARRRRWRAPGRRPRGTRPAPRGRRSSPPVVRRWPVPLPDRA